MISRASRKVDGAFVREASHPLLVVLSGPSGVGKDSMLDELERRGYHFHRVVTCTTRTPREGEREGVDYFFVTDVEFDRLIATGGLLEHAVVYSRRYGVPKQQVLDAMASGLDVYARTDVQGAATIKRLMPEALLVFVAPSSLAEIESRIRDRKADTEESIQRRLATAQGEMARQPEFAHVIVNAPGKLAAAVDRLEQVLESERRARG